MSKKPWTKEELEKLLILFGKMGSSHHAETQAPHKLILEMLKEHGYSWSDLDSLISKARGQASSEQVAIDEVSSNINLVFCDPDRVPYANVTINGHRETFPIDSEEMRQFFQREYWLSMKKMYGQGMAIPEKSLKDRIAWHKAQALFDGPTHPVFLRVGQRDKDTYFIDLGDKEGRAVKITSSGWELVAPPPIFFRRTIGMLPLPEPERGGSIDDLRPFANVSEDNFIMSVAWLLAALRPFGPYPPLILQGLTGRTKTTYAEFLIDLVDPNTIPVRDPPGCVDDLLVSALYSHALSFDNISKLSLSLSNALCRMSTGVGSVKREFYTRRQQVRFPQAAHPFILNGIDDFVTRADLQNRSGQIEMEKVLERKELEALKAEFAAARPRIFGALLDRMVVGLRNLPSTSVPDLTRKNPDLLRMIDFIKWVVACGFDNFLEIYEQNLLGSAYAILDGNELASAIKALMHHREQQGLTQPWRGNATELAETLKRHGYKPPADNPRRGAAGGIEAAGATVTQCVQHRSRLPKAQERHAVDRNFIIAVTTVTKDHAGLKR